jgi:uncharacterized protein (TIGR03067 family)
LTEAAREELRKLQGTWIIEQLDENGKKVADAELKGRSITFGATAFLLRKKGGTFDWIAKIKIDPTKKSINAGVEEGSRKGDLLPGIYELDGDTLKLCWSTDGDSRPKDFKPGDDRLLIVCKRVPVRKGEADLTGHYKSESIDIVGKRYVYDTIVEKSGDCYLVTYRVNKKLVYFGTGIRRGNFFALAWSTPDQAGITLYQIDDGGVLSGDFTHVGSPGFMGKETLTPVPR